MFKIMRGTRELRSGAEISQELPALLAFISEAIGDCAAEPGAFVQIPVSTPQVVADDICTDDEDEGVGFALVVAVRGDLVDAVWVYGPEDNVSPPPGITDRTPTFLTDEKVTIRAKLCSPVQNMPQLAGEVVHKDESGRLHRTHLKPSTYAAVVRAAAAVRSGDSPPESPPGVPRVTRRNAQSVLADLMQHVDLFDASAIAYSTRTLHNRAGRKLFE